MTKVSCGTVRSSSFVGKAERRLCSNWTPKHWDPPSLRAAKDPLHPRRPSERNERSMIIAFEQGGLGASIPQRLPKMKFAIRGVQSSGGPPTC